MSDRLRLAVLISGAGSSLRVLMEATRAGLLPVDLVHVNANRAEATGLALAEDGGIPTSVIDEATAGPSSQDLAVERLLNELDPDLVLLSGYMRILGSGLVNAFRGRMINQHPSLLPLYRGLHTYRRALEAGDTEHGASVHFVTPELDGGPVIAQVRVPVQAGDDEASLAARLKPREQDLLLAVLHAFARGQFAMGPRDVRFQGRPLRRPLQLKEDGFHE